MMCEARTKMVMLALAAGLCAGPARAEPAPGVTTGPWEHQLADTVRLGSVAALAPICGLRDESWAADLRRAAIQSATRSNAYDDPSLKRAPGSNLAISTLSFAEAEALESFAQASTAATCEPLAISADLDRADRIVLRFRSGMGTVAPGS